MTKHRNDLIIAPADDGDTGSTPSPINIEIGQWYWVKSQGYGGEEFEWLGCVTHVGSNHLQIKGPAEGRSTYSSRIHFDDFWSELRFEPNPEAVISDKIAHYQAIANECMNEARAITARLGVSTQGQLSDGQVSKGGNALMVLSGQGHLENYKSALVHAKEKELPALFEAIKKAHESAASWMTANTLPMTAMADGMKGTISEINDRIFNVSLYAGLTEDIVKCRDGLPAAFHEKLHVMQRMFYMDEECLLNYRHGGMSFDHIDQFDAWLSDDENMRRVLPFERCLIAMRVRRSEKERDWDGSLRSIFINIGLKESDKETFLYIRNGEQLHRLSCDLEFGTRIFPDKDMFDPARPSMVKMFASRVDEIISRDDYDERVAAENARKALSAKWRKENPKREWEAANPRGHYDWADPHRVSGPEFRDSDWHPFDPSSVYFDDIAEHFGDQMKEHNRIALIIQGLFDRSEVLHPHAPVKVWSPSSFAASIELVYDGSMVLHAGEAPDFDAYRERCNASLGLDSVVLGQELYWQQKEAEKETRRLDNDYRNKSEWRPKLFRPYGNPGPGYLAKMAEWKPRARTAKFAWHRLRQKDGGRWSGERAGDPLYTSISIPADRLFNVSAYKLGDYRQFFQDPRTRAQYLKWAPLLLAAEEYHAGTGKFEVQLPVKE